MVMAATRNDLDILRRKLGLGKVRAGNLFMSKLFVGSGSREGVSLTGPMVGAPYAAMVLETLIAGGAQKIIFFGWCGAVSRSVKIGDIVVPASAIIDEGTSNHYQLDDDLIAKPSASLLQLSKSVLKEKDLSFHEGVVWTTDAIFRETRERVENFQRQHVLAVDMETSALFSVGIFRKVDVAALMVVSDELSTFSWEPGFCSERFRKSLDDVAEAISLLSRHLLKLSG